MTKVKEELLAPINEAQKTMQLIQMELGAIVLAELRKESLKEAYKEQESIIQNATEEIRNEYGDGSVDLKTGEFVPQPEAEVVE